jgi:hypothetical protein
MSKKVLTVPANPTVEDVQEFARTALRNAPYGTVTFGLLDALKEDLASGLRAIAVAPDQDKT